MRLMTVADRPEALWLPLRIVQVVLRARPSASACWSRVSKPIATRTSPSSRILDDCRAFMSAPLRLGAAPGAVGVIFGVIACTAGVGLEHNLALIRLVS